MNIVLRLIDVIVHFFVFLANDPLINILVVQFEFFYLAVTQSHTFVDIVLEYLQMLLTVVLLQGCGYAVYHFVGHFDRSIVPLLRPRGIQVDEALMEIASVVFHAQLTDVLSLYTDILPL